MEFVSPISEKLRRFGSAMLMWRRAGYPVVPNKVLQERLEGCQECDYWDNGCKVCGCRQWKLYLATSECPLWPPKWGKHDDSSDTKSSP